MRILAVERDARFGAVVKATKKEKSEAPRGVERGLVRVFGQLPSGSEEFMPRTANGSVKGDRRTPAEEETR